MCVHGLDLLVSQGWENKFDKFPNILVFFIKSKYYYRYHNSEKENLYLWNALDDFLMFSFPYLSKGYKDAKYVYHQCLKIEEISLYFKRQKTTISYETSEYFRESISHRPIPSVSELGFNSIT